MIPSLKRTAAAVVVCATTFWSGIGAAALVSVDDPTYGVGSITRDTVTGREWLDLTFTLGMAFDTVASQLGAGGSFEGFSTANTSDVLALFTNGGLTHGVNLFSHTDQPRYDAALAAVTLFGATFASPEPRAGSYGFVNDMTGSFHYYDGIFTLNSATSPFVSSVNANFFFTTSSGSIGTWLFREAAVELGEPASVALFGFAIVGLGLARRRHRCQLSSTPRR